MSKNRVKEHMDDEPEKQTERMTLNATTAWKEVGRFFESIETQGSPEAYVAWVRSLSIHELSQGFASLMLITDLLTELSSVITGVLEEKGHVVTEVIVTEVPPENLEN